MKRISIVLLCILTVSLFNNNTVFSNDIAFPILKENKNLVYLFNQPNAERDQKYKKFLSASVKIVNGYSSGSGTICHYDNKENYAYVVSCGHLWSGNRLYDPQNITKAKIIAWYNENKLEQPKTYEAEVLFWCNDRGFDSSLLRFKPDWEPCCFSIAKDFNYTKNLTLNSLGCDGGTEVARYEVNVIKLNDVDIITRNNSPRPGRSGGGLLTNEGELVGICWGTSEIDGSGIGYFTSLESIKVVFEKNNFDWILKQYLIKIIDYENPSKKYTKEYIPIPSFNLSF